MLFAMVLLAACASDSPLSEVSRVVSAFKRAWEAAELLNPFSVSDCPGAMATGCVATPWPSSEFPATERNAGKFEALIFCEFR